MSDDRPSELEDRAYMASVREFVEHLKRYVANRDAVKQLERDATQNVAALGAEPPVGHVVQAQDGTQWHQSVALREGISLCRRPTSGVTEYAVMKHAPTGNEILNRGTDVGEVLKTFVQNQRQALRDFKESLATQVKTFLAENYPGHDLSRVAEGVMDKFTSQEKSERRTLHHQQKRGNRIGI